MLTGFRDWDGEGYHHSVSQGSIVLPEMKERRAWDWERRDGHASRAPSFHCRGGGGGEVEVREWGEGGDEEWEWGWGMGRVCRGSPFSPAPISIPDQLPW